MKIAIVIACLGLTGCGQPIGRYQLVSEPAGFMWKIDTATGDVWMCHVGQKPTATDKIPVSCTKAAHG